MSELDNAKTRSLNLGQLMTDGWAASSAGQFNMVGASNFINLQNPAKNESHGDFGAESFVPATEMMTGIGEDVAKGAERGSKLFASDITGFGYHVTGIDELDTWTANIRNSMPDDQYNSFVGNVVEEGVRIAPYMIPGMFTARAGMLAVTGTEMLAAAAGGYVRDPSDPNTMDALKSVGLTDDVIQEVGPFFAEAMRRGDDGPQYERRLMNAGIDSALVPILAGMFVAAKTLGKKAGLTGKVKTQDGNITNEINPPVVSQEFKDEYLSGGWDDFQVDADPIKNAMNFRKTVSDETVFYHSGAVDISDVKLFGDRIGFHIGTADQAKSRSAMLVEEGRLKSTDDAVINRFTLDTAKLNPVYMADDFQLIDDVTKEISRNGVPMELKEIELTLHSAGIFDVENVPAIAKRLENATPEQAAKVINEELQGMGYNAIIYTNHGEQVGASSISILDPSVLKKVKDPVKRDIIEAGVPSRKPPQYDFNFDRMNTEEEIIGQIEAVSEKYSKQINEAKRGIITHKETEMLSGMLGMTTEDFLALPRGTALNAEKTFAFRQILIESADNLTEMSIKIASGDATEKEMIGYLKAMDQHAIIQAKAKGFQTETARTLSQYNMSIGNGVVDVSSMLNDLGGSDQISKVAKRFLELADGAEKNAFINQFGRAKFKDVFFEFWINSLLSGVKTHVVNISSNTLFAAGQIPERFGAALIGKITKGPAEVSFREVGALAHGMVEGVWDGLALAGKAFMHNAPSNYRTKIETSYNKAISAKGLNIEGTFLGKFADGLGTVINLPGRALMAEDEFFKSVSFRGQLRALGMREYTKLLREGADKTMARARYSAIMRGDVTDITRQASDFAEINTFTNKLGEKGSSVQNMVNKIPILKLAAPFIRTPLNIVQETLKRGPAGFAFKSVREDLAAGGARRDMAMSKIALGSAVTYAGFSHAVDGRITGSGPSDPRELAQLRATGWQPYSIVFDKGSISPKIRAQLLEAGVLSETADKTYIAYNRLEPIGTWLAMAAGAADTYKYADEPDALLIATHASMETVKAIGDKTFLQGLTMIAEAYTDPDRWGAAYVKKLAGSMVPTIVADIARVQDPSLKDTTTDPNQTFAEGSFQSILDAVKARTPGLSKDVPNRVNIWGEDIKIGDGSWSEVVNPFYRSEGKNTPIDQELVELGAPISLPKREIEGVPLSRKEYRDFVKLRNSKDNVDPATGFTMRQTMEKTIKSDAYKELGPQHKIDVLKKISRKYQDAAAAMMIVITPGLQEKVENVKITEQLGLQQ
jgi:hypothetical protein